MRNEPNIYDVAEAVGVSTTTVHRALHGTGPVAEATRRRIHEAAAELGYRPNHLARSLAMGKSQVLGAVVWWGSSGWDATLVTAIEDAVRTAGYLLMLGFSKDDANREPQLLEAMLDHGVDGVVIFPTQPPADPELYAEARRIGRPLVFAVEPGPIPGDLVQTDSFRGGYEVARHLIQQGCRDLVFLRDDAVRDYGWCLARQAGATEALREAGLAPPTVLPVPGNGEDPECVRQALEEHLAGGGRLDALFGVRDGVALAALPALAQLGLRVPQDVGVAGFDDLPEAALSDPPLTSVRQDLREIGSQAVNLLLDRIAGRRKDPKPILQHVPAPLIVRASSDRHAAELSACTRLAQPKEVIPNAEVATG